MSFIQFKNLPDTTTPITAENLNAIQQREYAYLSGSSIPMTVTAWTPTDVAFDSGSSFGTNTSSDFERNGAKIKCKFSGEVLILRYVSHNVSSEMDIADEWGYQSNVGGYYNSSAVIKSVSANDEISLPITMGATSIDIYSARIIVIRLS